MKTKRDVDFVIHVLLSPSKPFFQWLSKWTSKPHTYVVGAVMFVIVIFFSFLFTPSTPAFALYVFAVLVGIGSGGVVIMVYAIFPDNSLEKVLASIRLGASVDEDEKRELVKELIG